VIAYSIIQDPHKDIGDWVWGEFLPKALGLLHSGQWSSEHTKRPRYVEERGFGEEGGCHSVIFVI
jgi:hypothetical protein